jgi:hypothetical protein
MTTMMAFKSEQMGYRSGPELPRRRERVWLQRFNSRGR